MQSGYAARHARPGSQTRCPRAPRKGERILRVAVHGDLSEEIARSIATASQRIAESGREVLVLVDVSRLEAVPDVVKSQQELSAAPRIALTPERSPCQHNLPNCILLFLVRPYVPLRSSSHESTFAEYHVSGVLRAARQAVDPLL
ncbi:uncharacterized protein SOCE836_034280 [Sorangium cellulosum]|uniref:Uncharacterized protein n=1 Tax=Sorangium cellulosum TaxID=56 RepID=A0A4P2QMJ9_SORCE|nr:uncharacterized protein SOCE836_034280 [Sorangium cellulosum]